MVLPEPLPAAGTRLHRLPQRRGAAAHDRPHHDRHDRARTAGDRPVRASGDDRHRPRRARRRHGRAVPDPRRRELLGRRAAGVAGRRPGYVAGIHPVAGHGHLQHPPGGGWARVGHRQHQLPGRVSPRPGRDDRARRLPRRRPAREPAEPDQRLLCRLHRSCGDRCGRRRARRSHAAQPTVGTELTGFRAWVRCSRSARCSPPRGSACGIASTAVSRARLGMAVTMVVVGIAHWARPVPSVDIGPRATADRAPTPSSKVTQVRLLANGREGETARAGRAPAWRGRPGTT